MEQATSIRPRRIRKSRIRKKTLAVILGSIVGVILAGYILVALLLPPSIQISPESGSQEVPGGSRIEIAASWMRGAVNSASVKETTLDPAGNPTFSRVIDGSVKGGVFVGDDGEFLTKTDSLYEVTVDATLTELTVTGPRRRSVTETSQFQTVITPAPIFSSDTQTVAFGQPIVVEFNTPVSSFTYVTDPAMQTEMRIDPDNPTRAYISFDGYDQGQRFSLTVTGAQAENGIGLQHPYSQTIATTDPLKVVFDPGDGQTAVASTAHPTLTFSEEIADKDAFKSMVTVEPQTAGQWNWVDDKTVQFVPKADWARGIDVNIGIKGGPEGLRSKGGSFLKEDVKSKFTTRSSKAIDVNLSTFTLTLLENDQPVRSFVVNEGSLATPSLTGTYTVYWKAEKVDMRGEGYFAPGVPWVLMFNGDYTIHGDYWSSSFGGRTSHGCVGLPVDEAEIVYDWTPIGAEINIHE